MVQYNDPIIVSQEQFEIGNVADGSLPSAFLAGLLIASIVYSELTTRFNAFRMIGAHPANPHCSPLSSTAAKVHVQTRSSSRHFIYTCRSCGSRKQHRYKGALPLPDHVQGTVHT